MIWDVHPGSGSRIRILIFYPSRIPDPGVKKALDPGSATLATRILIIIMVMISVADPDPGSGIGCLLAPGSGIRNRFIPDPGSQTHIFESLLTTFWVKSSIILYILGNLWLQKNVWQKIFFHSSLFYLFLDPGFGIRDPGFGIRDPRSGMGKNQDPGSGINIPDPQH